MAKKRKTPLKKKTNASGQQGLFSYAMASMQGWRKEMEDSHRITLSLSKRMKDWAYAGVFDGHSGKKASSYASENLHRRIVHEIKKSEKGLVSQEQGNRELDENNNSVEIPAQVGGESGRENPDLIREGIVSGFLKCDRTMETKNVTDDDSGTTAVCVIVSPTYFYFANCGDSRALLCREGRVQFATKDHKPDKKSEKKRIEQAGGFVRHNRVIGRLAMSRALGDFKSYKMNNEKPQCAQMVIARPDVTIVPRNNAVDEFIILACDGIFDVMSNYELITYVKGQMALTDDLTQVCNRVLDHCLEKGSTDNLSVILITLPGCPSKNVLERKRKSDFAKIRRSPKVAKVEEPKSENNKNSERILNRESISQCPIVVNASKQKQLSLKLPLQAPQVLRKDQAIRQHTDNRRLPNPFLLYFLDYWKAKGGNICEVAKLCGHRWKTRLRTARKEQYKRRYLNAKQKLMRVR